MQRLCGNAVFFYKFKYGKQKDLQENVSYDIILIGNPIVLYGYDLL